MKNWRIIRRTEPLEWGSFAIFFIAFGISLAVCAFLLHLQGKDGFTGVGYLLEGGFGSRYSLEDTVLKAIPIFLCSLGVALCFKLQVWNIGAEGQYVIGALGGAYFVLSFPSLPAVVMLPGMFISAALAGAFWALIAAVLRQKWNINEIIATLMLNYIGINILKHLIFGSLKDPAGMGFPESAYFAESARIMPISQEIFGRLHWGLFTCILAGAAVAFMFKKTRLGYELEAAGANERAARYAGMPYNLLVFFVMGVCGALAGIAGIQESASGIYRIDPYVPLGYGFTAVVVAWLARLRTLRIMFFSLILAGLRVGVENLQIELQVSDSFAATLEGFILLMVLAGQFFDSYILKRKPKIAKEAAYGNGR